MITTAQWKELAGAAQAAGIPFMASVFDEELVEIMDPLTCAFKIASGDNTFLPLLEVVARTGKPIILSTGLLDMEGVREAKNHIENVWRQSGYAPGLALLHCVVNYPTAPAHANLLALRQLQQLGTVVGYSDHTLGTEAAVLAVALGARIIEKHFTIDKHRSSFRDHQLSADPAELALLVQRVREAVELLGDGEKRLGENEREIAPRVRRSLVASRPLEKGKALEWDDFNWVRPGGGLAPGREGEVLGRPLLRPLRPGELITPEDCAPRAGE